MTHVPIVPQKFFVNDCIAMYEDFELARGALLELHRNIQERKLPQINTVEDLRNILNKHKKSHRIWLATMRSVIATAFSALTIPLAPAVGLLATLGFSVVEDRASKLAEGLVTRSRATAQKVFGRPSLTLLLKLDTRLKEHFRLG